MVYTAPFDVRSGRVADANASSIGRVSVVVVDLTRFESRMGLVPDEDASSLRLAGIAARDAEPLPERRASAPPVLSQDVLGSPVSKKRGPMKYRVRIFI